jgi:hypothetical protein
MNLTFVDRTNTHIDRLVQISWDARAPHAGEYLLVPERDEQTVTQLISDEEEREPPDEEVPYIDLSRFSGGSAVEAVTPVGDREPLRRMLIAVDSGIVHLGEFVGGGIAFAIRGSAVCLFEGQALLLRYNTGPLLIDAQNCVPVFQYIGSRLGNEELYLHRQADGKLVPDLSVLGDVNQVQDRCRNFVERLIQEEALGILVSNGRGLLLLDGALPAGTFDTPVAYLRDMLNTAASNRVDVMAVSKKSRIAVGGKPIIALFDERPTFVGYMPLKEALERERESYVQQGLARSVSAITLADELYAVRFGLGPPALTFRVEVRNSISCTSAEVLNNAIAECPIHGCYPRPLIEAHQFSSFLYQDVQLLTADLVVRTGARRRDDTSMGWMFMPFGALGK